MKISTNKEELKKLEACSSGYEVFVKAHGESTVTLSQCLKSNGWDDVWWLISETFDQFSDQQKIDLRLLGCEYALSVIDNFEKKYPKDKRPREAIEASKALANGEMTEERLLAVESAARLAVTLVARSAAWSAVESAARLAARSAATLAVESAVESAAWSAAWSAAMEINTKMLMGLFIKWENK